MLHPRVFACRLAWSSITEGFGALTVYRVAGEKDHSSTSARDALNEGRRGIDVDTPRIVVLLGTDIGRRDRSCKQYHIAVGDTFVVEHTRLPQIERNAG